MIAELLGTTQLRIGFLVFICAWVLGLALRFQFNKGTSSLVDLSTMPAYRQIRIIGILRWLFGYKPIDGPVSVAGFILQFPALLALMISMVLNLLWPTQKYLPLVPLGVLFISMPLAFRFADRLWHQQQSTLNDDGDLRR